jgi:hypothetical protein
MVPKLFGCTANQWHLSTKMQLVPNKCHNAEAVKTRKKVQQHEVIKD